MISLIERWPSPIGSTAGRRRATCGRQPPGPTCPGVDAAAIRTRPRRARRQPNHSRHPAQLPEAHAFHPKQLRGQRLLRQHRKEFRFGAQRGQRPLRRRNVDGFTATHVSRELRRLCRHPLCSSLRERNEEPVLASRRGAGCRGRGHRLRRQRDLPRRRDLRRLGGPRWQHGCECGSGGASGGGRGPCRRRRRPADPAATDSAAAAGSSVAATSPWVEMAQPTLSVQGGTALSAAVRDSRAASSTWSRLATPTSIRRSPPVAPSVPSAPVGATAIGSSALAADAAVTGDAVLDGSVATGGTDAVRKICVGGDLYLTRDVANGRPRARTPGDRPRSERDHLHYGHARHQRRGGHRAGGRFDSSGGGPDRRHRPALQRRR